jgi:hypothetical protein
MTKPDGDEGDEKPAPPKEVDNFFPYPELAPPMIKLSDPDHDRKVREYHERVKRHDLIRRRRNLDLEDK